MQLTCKPKERRRLLTHNLHFATILQWTCLKMKLELLNNPIILLLRQGMEERILLQELGSKQIPYISVWIVQYAKIWPVFTASVTLLFHCATVVIVIMKGIIPLIYRSSELLVGIFYFFRKFGVIHNLKWLLQWEFLSSRWAAIHLEMISLDLLYMTVLFTHVLTTVFDYEFIVLSH